MKLPDSWRELVIEHLSAREEVDAMEKKRVNLEERLLRVKKQYRDLEIGEHEYKQELELTLTQIARLAPPEGQVVVQLGDNVEGLVLAWHSATKEERHEMLRLMLDAVYVDVNEKTVVGLQPKPSFLPLFNLDEPVRARKVVLATDLTIGRGGWIRTTDLYVPNVALCHAEPHPDCGIIRQPVPAANGILPMGRSAHWWGWYGAQGRLTPVGDGKQSGFRVPGADQLDSQWQPRAIHAGGKADAG